MATFYVETCRPTGGAGLSVRIHRDKDYCPDILSPDMTSVWRVDHVRTKQDAVACVIEHAAGKGVSVRRIH